MKTPIIKKIDFEEKIKHLAPQYTPEWIYDEEDPDVGVTFSKVMSKMFDSTVRFYNKMPDNCYKSFLNLMGVKLAPPVSAKGMVTVETTKGSKGVYIRKNSPLYAIDPEAGKVFFETLRSMYALDIGIGSIYYLNGMKDEIYKVYDPETKNPKSYTEKPFRLFANQNENLQSHEFYIRNDELLLGKDGTDLTVSIKDKRSLENNKFLLKLLLDPEKTSWYYYKDEQWHLIENIKKTGSNINLKFDSSSDIYQLNKNESGRFIKCVVNDLPNEFRVTNIGMSTKASELSPDVLLCNMSELEERDFFPFGEELSTYTDFYIATDEALTKKNAEITIDVEMQFLQVEIENNALATNIKYKNVMDKSDFEEPKKISTSILKVSWEYWNGLGWSKLYKDNTNEEFFKAEKGDKIKKKLKFKCPADLQADSIGPAKSHFIRARIKKLKNPYNSFQNFISPYIHEIKISYDYKRTILPCDEVAVKSDLLERKVDLTVDDDVKVLFKRTPLEAPVMYISLTNPIDKGPFKILFDVEETLSTSFPSVQWEYYAVDKKGVESWEYMQVLDDTGSFEHSGIVTFAGKNDFKKTELFGEEAYFIRLVNVDKAYGMERHKKDFPTIKGMHANTVSVKQRETVLPEYFPTGKFDENKVCKLSKKNVFHVRAWVNELGSLSAEEEKDLIETADGDRVQIEKDSNGRIYALWVEWDEINSIAVAKPDARNFEVSFSKGLVVFGNSRHGKIPPHQETKGIKISYSLSQGSKGNVDVDQIAGLTKSVSYISNVKNLKSMCGGIDQETEEQASERMATELAGMNRIVSMDDFEYFIKANNRNVDKIKCVAHINSKGEKAPGRLSIAVLPSHYMQGYEKFAVLRDDIYDIIKKKAPVTMLQNGKIDIFEVFYVELDISLDVIIGSYDYCQDVNDEVTEELKKLLDPVTGNSDHKGWSIGSLPSKEQIYNATKAVNKIKMIRNVTIFSRIVTSHGKEDVDYEKIKDSKFVIPVFGSAEVNLTVEEDYDY